MVLSPIARRGGALLLALVLLLTLGACRQKEPVSPDPSVPSAPEDPIGTEPEPPQTETPPDVPAPQIGSSNFEKTYSAGDGTELLSLSYALPKIENADGLSSLCMINAFYEAELQRLINLGQNDLLDSAQKAAESEAFFAPYFDEESFTEEYRSDSRISFLRAHPSYTGGAHPNLMLFSDNFDYTTGLRLTAADFFSVPLETYTPRLVEEIKRQIETDGAENYYDGYQEMLPHIFDPNKFYLTGDGIVFYFQPYDIAPYATGTPSFLIPFSELEDILISWT